MSTPDSRRTSCRDAWSSFDDVQAHAHAYRWGEDGLGGTCDPWQHPASYEHFGGDDGAGLSASHQTGWTGRVAEVVRQTGRDVDLRPRTKTAKKAWTHPLARDTMRAAGVPCPELVRGQRGQQVPVT